MNKLLIASGLLFLASSFAYLPLSNELIYADSVKENLAALNQDGTYNVPLKTDLKMKDEVFNHTAIIEKMGENVYMTFTQDDARDMTDMKLLLPGNIGTMTYEKDISKSYVYTLSEEDLNKTFPFSVFIPIMSKTVTFNMNLLMDKISYVKDSIRDLGERPARYVPIINADVNDLELEKGTTYFLPKVSATLLDEPLEVKTYVSYLKDDKNEEVKINENKFVLDKIGTYKVSFSAESELYKTSLGNNTKSEVSFIINSKVGASILAKFVDTNNSVDDKAQLQANILTSGKEFEKISDAMKNIADHYQVFKLDMFLENGDKITLEKEIEIYLKVDQFFDRTKIKIAHLDDDGKLSLYDTKNYGSYVAFNSKELGNYVAYVEGVAFVMPIWGYVLIGGSVLLLVICAVSTILIIKHKNKVSKAK